MSRAMSLWLQAPGDAPADTPGLSPPSFTEGSPGRYFRITRGLLCRRDDDAVIDMGELLLRSGSLAAFRGPMLR
jgi:hypothetical protein